MIEAMAIVIVAVVVAMEYTPWDQHRGVELQTVAGSLNAAIERSVGVENYSAASS